MKKQLFVHFSGRVHGVGFRFTASRLARHFDVTGYVKNLPDGRVELLAEGEETVLQDYFKAVCESDMKLYIRDAARQWNEAEGVYGAFGIAT